MPLAALLLAFSLQAEANNAGQSDEITQVDALVSMINNMLAVGGAGVAGMFSAYGSNLLTALTVIAIAWVGIKNVIESQGINKTLADTLVVVLLWGIAAWLINPSGDAMREINGGFDMVANQALYASSRAANNSGVSPPPTYSPGDTSYGTAASKYQAQNVVHVLEKSMSTALDLFSDSPGERAKASEKAREKADTKH